MAQFLRVIRQARWFPQPSAALGWLMAGEIQSDALLDLQTRDNALSVYRFDNDIELEIIIVGLASNRENLANLDYISFDEQHLASAGIIFVKTDGDTPCSQANMLHYDLRELTVHKVAMLAQVISGSPFERIREKDIKNKIINAMESGLLDRSLIKDSLLQKLT